MMSPRPRKPEEEKSSNLIIRLPNPVIWKLESEKLDNEKLERYIERILSDHVKK